MSVSIVSSFAVERKIKNNIKSIKNYFERDNESNKKYKQLNSFLVPTLALFNFKLLNKGIVQIEEDFKNLISEIPPLVFIIGVIVLLLIVKNNNMTEEEKEALHQKTSSDMQWYVAVIIILYVAFNVF